MDLLTKALTQASIEKYIVDEGLKGEKGDKGDKGDPGDVSLAQLNEVKDELNNVKQDLDESVSDLNGVLSEVGDGFYPYKIIPDTYISGAGVETYYAGWSSSDFIPVVADNTVRIVGTVSSIYNSFYDSNKAFISGKNFTVKVGENEIKIPSDAAYMRLSNTTPAMANEKVYSLTSVRLSDVETTLNGIISEEKQNYYTGITLLSGRVFQGVYDSDISTIHCTDYLTLIPGHVYALYGGYMDSNYTNYYNKAKTYMGAMPLTVLMNAYPYGSSYNCALFTAPADCYYTRINFMNSDLNNGELQSGWYLRDITERVLAQKKVLVVGDSISADVYGNYKKWVTDLIENGTLTQGLTYNTSQHATGFFAIYSTDTNSTFIKRITALGDLSGYDMVVTFGGINDWIQSINFDDFKNAVDTYFAYLVENATQARIVVLSPMHTALYGTANNVGKTQKDYADYIKEVARAYSFPLLNLTDESGFCPDKSATFRDMWTLLPAGFQEHDGVHPTAEWELKYLAPQIADFLEGLMA